MKFTTLRRVAAATGNRSRTAAVARPGRPMRAGAILAAGALGGSRKKFFISFGLARAVRYSLVAWLAALYGRAMVRAFRHYLNGWSTILMWVYLGLMVAAILYGVWKFRRERRQTAAPQAAAVSAN